MRIHNMSNDGDKAGKSYENDSAYLEDGERLAKTQCKLRADGVEQDNYDDSRRCDTLQQRCTIRPMHIDEANRSNRLRNDDALDSD